MAFNLLVTPSDGFYQIVVLVLKIFYIVFAGLQFFMGLEKFGIEKKEIERKCHTKFSWEVVIPFEILD
jgi:hypothetical protein